MFTQTAVNNGERDDDKIDKKNEFVLMNSSSNNKFQHKFGLILNQSKKGKEKMNLFSPIPHQTSRFNFIHTCYT